MAKICQRCGGTIVTDSIDLELSQERGLYYLPGNIPSGQTSQGLFDFHKGCAWKQVQDTILEKQNGPYTVAAVSRYNQNHIIVGEDLVNLNAAKRFLRAYSNIMNKVMFDLIIIDGDDNEVKTVII